MYKNWQGIRVGSFQVLRGHVHALANKTLIYLLVNGIQQFLQLPDSEMQEKWVKRLTAWQSLLQTKGKWCPVQQPQNSSFKLRNMPVIGGKNESKKTDMPWGARNVNIGPDFYLRKSKCISCLVPGTKEQRSIITITEQSCSLAHRERKQ